MPQYPNDDKGDREPYFGPRVERSEKVSRGHSKRIILFFLLAIGALISIIAYQANFKQSADASAQSPQAYRPPNQNGFQEMVADMEEQRRRASLARQLQARTPTVRQAEPTRQGATAPQRVVVQRPAPRAKAKTRYYSNQKDAQAAGQLHALKVQALLTRPAIDEFTSDLASARSQGVPAASQSAQAQVQAVRGASYPSSANWSELAEGLAQEAQDPGGQLRKQEFLRGQTGGASLTPQGYSESLPVPQAFPLELKAGTIIPGILIGGINSDLPGNVLAQVSENVWDTATGRHVLIPKGTKIMGAYDSEVTYGQRRVLLVWNRLIFPNGTTLNIAGSPGTDQAGYAGLSGRVDEHWGRLVGSALFASLFVAGAEIIRDDDRGRWDRDKKSPSDIAAESAAGAILDMSSKILAKASDVQPTIRIRPGKRMSILVQQDVVFPFPYF